MNYVHLPFNMQTPDPKLVEHFMAAVAGPANTPACTCIAPPVGRAAALWMIKRVKADGWTEATGSSRKRNALGLNDRLRPFAHQLSEMPPLTHESRSPARAEARFRGGDRIRDRQDETNVIRAQTAAVRMAQTAVLDIAYEETGNAQGFPVILLHGFPDDARAYDEVVGPLAKQGYRAIVPYLRGYGPTRFRDASAPRMAEQAAIGQDVIDLADALKVRASPSPATTGAGAPQASPPPCIRIASAPRC